ncbi:hypothetical protein CgunFtcFv8_025320 [Champsocephalus gunnari]|uniref:Uncharacterized protein n=1 Tax=Champsocephalus gunnari TaxID=52237 RepID=A0AAN8CB21_CHAGU|nr:hypothetical protein CgunFtcFv8_025320 [Champsocephalus gunnari]
MNPSSPGVSSPENIPASLRSDAAGQVQTELTFTEAGVNMNASLTCNKYSRVETGGYARSMRDECLRAGL